MIDAHHHLWQIGRNGQTWPTPDLAAIYRDFGLDDLRSVSAGQGLIGTIVVQSQPCDADTNWLLEVAADNDLIRGVVGWADLAAPNAAARIAHLARQPKLKGLRPMLQGLSDDNWISQPAVRPAIEAMIVHDLSFDALVFARHLPAIGQLAKDHPNLRIVIDHGAKPPIASRHSHPEETRNWREQISIIARNPNVFVKLSGLVTEMMPGQDVDELWPYADHLLESFGPSRTMWGSDWPVVNLRLPYRTWHERLHAHLRAHLSFGATADLDQVFSTTATQFYRLTPEKGTRS